MLVPEPAELSDMATLEFCASISSHLPRIIVSEPLAGKPPLECFSIIPEHVVAHGGEQLNGWAIWIHPRVFVEAEFHAVWRDDAGELHDLTPRILPTEYITFSPDPNRQYIGRQVDNIRKALVDDPDVARYLRGSRRTFDIMNEGDLANQHGRVELSPRAYLELRKIEKEMASLYLRIARKYR